MRRAHKRKEVAPACIASDDEIRYLRGKEVKRMKRRSIAIVGAGVAGLHVAYGLSRLPWFDIVLFTGKPPAAVRSGRLLTTQVHGPELLQRERRFGVPDYGKAYAIREMHFAVDGKTLFRAPFGRQAVSVDQRLYYPALVEGLARRGVRVRTERVDRSSLTALAGAFDAIVDCTGRGGPIAPFPICGSLSPYAEPQRFCSAGFFLGIEPEEDGAFHFMAAPGHGELFETSIVTTRGVARSLLLEAAPGGGLHVMKGAKTARQFEERMLRAVEAFFPETYRRIDRSRFRLIDDLSFAHAALTPKVRVPFLTLEGTLVLACGDAAALNDPITGQGANTASYCAEQLCAALEEERENRWDASVGIKYWRRIQHYVTCVTEWTNAAMGPMPESVERLVGECATDTAKAEQFVRLFLDPPNMHALYFGASAAEGDARRR